MAVDYPVSTAAKRYAQAAFELAVEHNATSEWGSALDQMAAFMSDPEIRRVLENTRAPQETKQRLISAGLAGLPPMPLNLARLLVRKGRSSIAQEVADAFRQLLEDKEGISRAWAMTAVPLSDTERQALAQRLQRETGRRIILDTAVDPDLIGGVRVQIGDQLVDASTRAKLAALRQSLIRAL